MIDSMWTSSGTASAGFGVPWTRGAVTGLATAPTVAPAPIAVRAAEAMSAEASTAERRLLVLLVTRLAPLGAWRIEDARCTAPTVVPGGRHRCHSRDGGDPHIIPYR